MTAPFSPPLAADEVSKVLSRYTDIMTLAVGGQGALFRATSPENVPVAIKIYAPEQTQVRAELEVQKLQRVHSEFVVQSLESGYVTIRDHQSFYSVTQFQEGEDLRRSLARGPLSEAEVRTLIIDMCTAIDELWRVKVVHCDIKPENIVCGVDGHFHVVDLGLAKHLDIQTITQYGMTFGTLGYMAPEQMVGRKNYTLRVDLFALGIVAYESLTGKHPFGMNQLLIGNSGVVIPPAGAIIQVSSGLDQVIMKLLNRNPVFRPRSGADVIAMIGR